MPDFPDTALRRSRQAVAEHLARFDNHDPRIPYHELALERSLEDLPECPLPAGHAIVPYAPGDRAAWIAIERSARELSGEAQGLEVWAKYFAPWEDLLPERMFFVTDPAGEKAATATAWWDIRRENDGVNGMLHWVAVRRDVQGRGLAKPLILHTLRRMAELGCRRAVIPTQTTTWLACKVYLDLGFTPIPRNAERCRTGWRIVRTLTEHPALAAFEPLPEEELTGGAE